MGRPRHEQPTPAELEALKVLWDRGPSTVRDVMEALERDGRGPRAYTSVMSLLNVMADKGLVDREPRGRAFAYRPARDREQTLGAMLRETLGRVFDGSASQLVAHLLDESHPDPAELDRIRSLIDAYQERRSEAKPRTPPRNPSKKDKTRGGRG